MSLASTIKPSIQLTLDDNTNNSQFTGDGQVVSDARFGNCVTLQAGETLTLTQMSQIEGTDGTVSVWIKRMTSDSILKLGTGTDYLRIYNDGTIALFQSDQKSGDADFQSTTQGVVSQLTTGEWHHVAWVRSGSDHSLYLDGALLEIRAVETNDPVPSVIKNFSITTGTACFSHFHLYYS